MEAIDIHTHGIGGYDTKTDSAEHILRIAGIHGSYGTVKILPAIYPAQLEEMRRYMMSVKMAMGLQQVKNSRHRAEGIGAPYSNPPFESQISGIYLEGPFLNPAQCGALDPSSFLNPTTYNLHRLLDGFEDVVKIITVAPELDGAINLIKAITDMGITVSMGHSDATYREAEAGFHAGAKGITHIFNAMRAFHHREPGVAGFGLMNRHVYIEVIADPYHLHRETIKLIFSVKNHEKIVIVSDAVKETLKNEDFLTLSEVQRQNEEHENHPPAFVPHSRRYGIATPRAKGMRTPSGKTPTGLLTEDLQSKAISQCLKNPQGRLCGGSMTVVESAGRLIQMGYKNKIITNCVTSNPEKYLKGRL